MRHAFLPSLLLASAALLLGGCARDKPLETACPALGDFTYPRLAMPQVPGRMASMAEPRSMADAFREAYRPVDRPVDPNGPIRQETQYSDALILSGGGQWGAYGAGFFDGWNQNGRLPARIVTGISTGALQATFAYLGDAPGLVGAYSITDERQLVHRYGNSFFLTHGSTADIAPLKDYVMAHVRDLIPAVAAEYEGTHRKLFVGAVDGLSGLFHMIDLTEISASKSLNANEKADCYVAALLASAAVPVVFRQVTINERPWLDGGVRRALFLPDMIQQIALARSSRASDDIETDGVVWAIKNGETGLGAVSELPAKLLPTINRLRSISFNQIENDSLDLAAFHARLSGLELYYTSADGWRESGLDVCKGVESGEEDRIFDPAFMQCQISFGRSRWASGSSPWKLRKVD